MKSARWIGAVPRGLQLVADDVTEFHATRLLLLLKHCGVSCRIDGLTKLAKLDFLVRYPSLFNELAEHLGKEVVPATTEVESPMIRHHYGPWDKRYYQVLPFLEARGLISVTKEGSTYVFSLTDSGKGLVSHLNKRTEFVPLIQQMKQVKQVAGDKTGSTLKRLIYEVFDEEVAAKPMGEVIR
ncbi:MAG: hypothetical protein ACYC7E_04535 [Armatimonadota bacterium]